MVRHTPSLRCQLPPKSLSVGARQKSGRGPASIISRSRKTYEVSRPRFRSKVAEKSGPATWTRPSASITSNAGNDVAGSGSAGARVTSGVGRSAVASAMTRPQGSEICPNTAS